MAMTMDAAAVARLAADAQVTTLKNNVVQRLGELAVAEEAASAATAAVQTARQQLADARAALDTRIRTVIEEPVAP